MTIKKMFMLVVILSVGMACSLFAPSTPDVEVAPKPDYINPTITIFGLDNREEPTTVPLQTAPPRMDAVEGVTIDYVYTSNLITVIYPLYGSMLDDFVTITLTNDNPEPIKLLVMSEVEGYTTQTRDTVEVEANSRLEVRQNPRLIPEKIDELNVQKPAQFHFQVKWLSDHGEKTILDETGETLVYARRDFPWAIPGFTEEEVFELITSMATPNDPAVEALIRDAADYTDSGTMWNGYGGRVDDEGGEVWDRLGAIWEAEDKVYQITYISTMVTYAPGDVQRIRLPSEVLEQRSGNCIELALLFAAAAEALELETALIRIPGHAYMAVRMDLQNANYYFIETTMIGRFTFEEAVSMGAQEFEQALPHMEAGDQYYDWITVQDARARGILPLPWR
jgi:hypothetical protein